MDVPRWFLLFFAVALYCVRFSTGSVVPQFIKVGCFKDDTDPLRRALPELLVNYRLPPYASRFDWSNMNKVVHDCALEAAKKNYMYFSIQFYGECWSGKTAPLTYDRYGVSSHCTPKVGKENANLVYRFVGTESECLKYRVLNSANRSSSYQLQKGSSPSCDNSLHHAWYRFLPPGGDRLASSCVPVTRCGTVVTGYLRSNPPKMTDGIVGGEVCFNNDVNCCRWNQTIQVRNCGRFFVYKLNPPPQGCPMRFCAHHEA